MNKNDIMKYALIAGGAYLVYWYVTNYGPTGAVKDQAGNPNGMVSYWDMLFGANPTTQQAATAPGAGVAAGIAASAPASASAGAVTQAQHDAALAATAAQLAAVAPNPQNAVGTMPVDPNAPATQDQINTILSAISPSDRTIFQAWINANKVTNAMAAQMIQNIVVCRPGAPVLSGGVSQGCTVSQTLPGVAQLVPAGVSGFGDIVPAPSRTVTAPGMAGLNGPVNGRMKSPWGRLPTGNKYVN